MSQIKNIIQWGAGALLGLAIAGVSFRAGYAFGGGDAEAMRELREYGEYQSAQIERGKAIFQEEHRRRIAAQSRLDAIDAILLDCETIHGDRGPDGVWTFALFKGDGTAWEVKGRTLDVLIGGAQ